MLNLKELSRLKKLIDLSVDSDELDVIIIRNKIVDMITLQNAWNTDRRIEVEKIHDYAVGP